MATAASMNRIQQRLAELDDLNEWLLEDIAFSHAQMDLRLTFDDVWGRSDKRQGRIRRVRLTCGRVRTVRLDNALNEWQLREPDEVGWSVNLVGTVTVKPAGEAEAGLPPTAVLTIGWNRPGREIVVVHSDLAMRTSFVSPPRD